MYNMELNVMIPSSIISGVVGAVMSLTLLVDPLAAKDVLIEAPNVPDAIANFQRKLNVELDLRLPCGLFEISEAIELPSGSRFEGSGPCTVIKMAADMKPARLHEQNIPGASGTLRAIFTNKKPGDADIVVKNLTVDGTNSPGNAHLISFYRAKKIEISNIVFIGSRNAKSQDALSMIASTTYVVRNNSCTGFANACYDQWDGSSKFEILDNTVEGDGQLTYGILINGISTNYTAATSSNFKVKGNSIRNVKHLGIGAYGLCSPQKNTCGAVANGIIENNNIDKVSIYHGIWVGNASVIRIENNVIKSARKNGIRIAAENPGGITRDILLKGNLIETRGDGEAGILVGMGADRVEAIRLQSNSTPGYAKTLTVAPGITVEGN